MIESRIHLHRRELPRVKLQTLGRGQVLWVERTAPVVVTPGARPDSNRDVAGGGRRVLFHLLVFRFRRAGWMRSAIALAEFAFEKLERDFHALFRENRVVPRTFVADERMRAVELEPLIVRA